MDYTQSKLDPGFSLLGSKDPLGSREANMEINNHYSHLNRKDIPHSPPLGSPTLLRNREMTLIAEQQLQEQLLALKQQQQMQQQMLLQQFQQQQQQLAQEHDKQIQEHIKVRLDALMQQMIMLQKQQEYLEQQKKEDEDRRARELREHEKLEMIKHKNKNEESAIASTEVKQRLQEFVLKKKQQEAAMTGMRNSPPQLRQWTAHHSSIDQSSPPHSGLSPPYHPRLIGAYEEDFPPLRKTASEPNLKVRSVLKQKVIERRSSPLLKRKDKALLLKRKPPLTIDTTLCNSNPDSGPNSPPNSANVPIQSSNGNLLSSTTHEAMKNAAGLGLSNTDLSSLYTSPSMPNISLGKPPSVSSHLTATASEAEVRARAAARFGLPLTGHLLSGTLPYYPSLPAIDGEFTPPTSPAYITAQMKALEAQGTTKIPTKPMVVPLSMGGGGEPRPPGPPRLHRHRPLERTQSAPLPLGNPLVHQQSLLLQQQHDQFVKEHQKMYLKQHIRQTVLQRAGSKSHMENVDEETEAKLAQEMKESREREDDDVVVIRDSHESLVNSELESQQREREAFLQQQRDLVIPKTGSVSSVRPILHRPLSRTHSSPLVTYSMSSQRQEQQQETTKHIFTTGLAYDSLMLKHQCTCGNNANHPEHAGRLQSIWARLQETRLLDRCEKIKSRKATIEELQSCHSEAYALLYGTNPHNRQKLDPKLLESLPLRFCVLPCGGIGVDSDTVWNEIHTSHASRMAVGCVVELAMKVAAGELKNGLAVVRPPGHHAEIQQAMGFCYFNSIAIAAKQLQERLKVEKILIVDWDVHHGNGTQQIFYNDPRVLYLSLHRHDNGNFFPGTGALNECGGEGAVGYNVNLPWCGGLNPPLGDAEYLAAFRAVIMPIARAFSPDVLLVSAGFDAAMGHPSPLGGYQVSSACFGHMTKQLMQLANGKGVFVLEGGYDLPAICDASEVCVQALLGDEIPPIKEEEFRRAPCQNAIESIERTIRVQGEHWPSVLRYLNTIHYSALEAQKVEREEADTVSALASLSMVAGHSLSDTGSSMDSEPMEES